MSPRILLEPLDLRHAATTYHAAGGSLIDIRTGLSATPPAMPADLAARAGHVLDRARRDLDEQVRYLEEEYAALKRRARWAERADSGRFDAAYLRVFDLLGQGNVRNIGERFRMPVAPKAKRKGFWDTGIPGYLNGAAGNVKKTVKGIGDLASMPFHDDSRHQFIDGLDYVWHHRRAAAAALWDDVSDKKDREAGNTAKAAGSITIEVAGVFVSALKATKLTALKEASETANATKAKSVGQVTAARGRWAESASRANNAPRWRRGEVPVAAKGASPGRWADPQEFRGVVLKPAEQALSDARQHAADAERTFTAAQERYERWEHGIRAAEKYDHAALASKPGVVTNELGAHQQEAASEARR